MSLKHLSKIPFIWFVILLANLRSSSLLLNLSHSVALLHSGERDHEVGSHSPGLACRCSGVCVLVTSGTLGAMHNRWLVGNLLRSVLTGPFCVSGLKGYRHAQLFSNMKDYFIIYLRETELFADYNNFYDPLYEAVLSCIGKRLSGSKPFNIHLKGK